MLGCTVFAEAVLKWRLMSLLWLGRCKWTRRRRNCTLIPIGRLNARAPYVNNSASSLVLVPEHEGRLHGVDVGEREVLREARNSLETAAIECERGEGGEPREERPPCCSAGLRVNEHPRYARYLHIQSMVLPVR